MFFSHDSMNRDPGSGFRVEVSSRQDITDRKNPKPTELFISIYVEGYWPNSETIRVRAKREFPYGETAEWTTDIGYGSGGYASDYPDAKRARNFGHAMIAAATMLEAVDYFKDLATKDAADQLAAADTPTCIECGLRYAPDMAGEAGLCSECWKS